MKNTIVKVYGIYEHSKNKFGRYFNVVLFCGQML